MSVLLGFHLGEYVLLAADTRITWYPQSQPMRWKDGRTKIQQTSLGLIGGTGLVSLLDPVKDRFEDAEVKHTDDIVRIIWEEYERVREEGRWDDDRVRGSLKQTGWMFTYFGCDDPTNLCAENTSLRLGIYHPDISERQRGIIAPGNAIVLMPFGTTQEQFDAISEAANQALKTSDELPNFEENLQYHVPLVAALIRTVSDWNETVSPTFVVGVQSRLHGAGISNVAGDGAPFALTVGGT